MNKRNFLKSLLIIPFLVPIPKLTYADTEKLTIDYRLDDETFVNIAESNTFPVIIIKYTDETKYDIKQFHNTDIRDLINKKISNEYFNNKEKYILTKTS